MLKKRILLKPGYQAYNGYIFNQSDCDRYNIIQDRINAFIRGGLRVPSDLVLVSHRTYFETIGRPCGW